MDNRSPFLEVRSFVVEEAEPAPIREARPPGSPFLAVYQSEVVDRLADPRAEEFALFFNDLYDETFEHALATLASEASQRYQAVADQETGFAGSGALQAERALDLHFAPLVAEAHAMLDKLAGEFRARDANTLTEDEIDEIVDRYQSPAAFEPAFEEFFGKLKKMVKKVAGKAHALAQKGIGLATKLGMGPMLLALKPLIKPLLKRVIQFAIGKLPPKLQPLARKLAEKMPMLKEADEGEDHHSHLETCELAQVQLEFNAHVANLLFAHDQAEMDNEFAEALTEEREAGSNAVAELDEARERFVEGLGSLREGEDPAPHVQQFIPAILPALKLGISVVGRKNVVNFLAKFIAGAIKGFVGPQFAPQLSQAIVDAGLKLIQLEAGPQDESRASASAIAATVEETVRRMGDMPEYLFEEPELLEAAALEAFEEAAAANLPPVLGEPVYRKRPELGQARRLRGTWVTMPGGCRKRYKKFTRMIPVRVAPHQVAAVQTFGGGNLGEHLEETLGVEPGETVDAVAHLYETIAGGRAGDIPQLDGSDLHPLTREAATALFNEADLGRDESLEDGDGHTAQAGHRLYHLEVPGKRPLATPGATGAVQKRRPSQVRLTLDFERKSIGIVFFLSEIRAQEIAVRLRQNAHAGLVAARLAGMLERGLAGALSGRFGRLKIVHEALTPEKWQAALRRLPSFVTRMLLARMREWTVKALLQDLRRNSAAFIKAAEDTSDGVSIAMTIADPPGFKPLRVALSGKGISIGDLKMRDGAPKVDIKFRAGFADA